jgi:hypothetical protein
MKLEEPYKGNCKAIVNTIKKMTIHEHTFTHGSVGMQGVRFLCMTRLVARALDHFAENEHRINWNICGDNFVMR